MAKEGWSLLHQNRSHFNNHILSLKSCKPRDPGMLSMPELGNHVKVTPERSNATTKTPSLHSPSEMLVVGRLPAQLLVDTALIQNSLPFIEAIQFDCPAGVAMIADNRAVRWNGQPSASTGRIDVRKPTEATPERTAQIQLGTSFIGSMTSQQLMELAFKRDSQETVPMG